MKPKLKCLECAAALFLVAAPASAAKVIVSNAWVRSLPGNAAGYFVLTNAESHTITLTGAASNACGMLMLHKTAQDGGMASMSDVSEIKLAPNETVKFVPGSYHLMCMNPKTSVRPGSQIAIELQFADKSRNKIMFAVKNAAGH